MSTTPHIGFNALPPFHLHSSTPTSPSTAHSLLSTFLSIADSNAAYRPDSTLSERGPTSSTSGTNLTLHSLNRIKLGLEGVRIGGLDLDGRVATNLKRKREGGSTVGASAPSVPFDGAEGEAEAQAEAEEEEQWQDKDDYELAQDSEGEMDLHNAQRDPSGAEQPSNTQEERDMVEIGLEGTGRRINPLEEEEQEEEVVVDKEERKRLKKLKRSEQRKIAEEKGVARGKKEKAKRESKR